MKRDQVIATLRNLKTNLRVLGVHSLALFDSVAR